MPMLLGALLLALTQLHSEGSNHELDRFRARQREAAAAFERANPDPGDWACARPLIERNHKRRDVGAASLALRIADECTRPLQPGANAVIHATAARNFAIEIESAIYAARRKADVVLY